MIAGPAQMLALRLIGVVFGLFGVLDFNKLRSRQSGPLSAEREEESLPFLTCSSAMQGLSSFLGGKVNAMSVHFCGLESKSP